MFLIEVNEKSGVWNNTLEDDFIRFLPSHFKCLPQDISVHHIPNDVWQACTLFEASGGRIELGQGRIRKLAKVTVAPQKEGDIPVDDYQVTEEIPLKPLKSSWPYEDRDGTLIFLGMEVEE
ncbi:MAG: hypothetical protein EBU84_21365 [Actinobacteria bacterium]|nr:hypothetical protein [Actinomycetota bacterium]